ncbi:DUF418 domain-containing protein [bacterium]|nr:DUF418 domain-containing protein [bacterium]
MPTETMRFTPVARDDRLAQLDTLRGFALLGILVMNIQSFSMPGAAYFFPTAYGDLSGANYWVWYLSEILARRKFMTLFSMLFGAGIVLMDERATAAGRGWAGLHYRRIGWLWLMGLAHAYLLWDGDILVAYAVCGVFMFLFRKIRPGRLLAMGLIFLAIGCGLMLMAGLSAPRWPEKNVTEFNAQWQPDRETVEHTLADMRGGWESEIRHRAPGVLSVHLFFIPFSMFWRAGGCMLLGMALFKRGWLQGRGNRRSYVTAIVLGLLVGVPLSVYSVHLQQASGWDPIPCFFVHIQYAYWGSLLIALGYVGALMLVLRSGVLKGLTTRLAAVGRMALSNYLSHTIICTTLFLGHGFGLFGSVSRIWQAVIVVVIWGAQLAWSPLWLRHFRFGPAEWLWRSLSYMRRQPLRAG